MTTEIPDFDRPKRRRGHTATGPVTMPPPSDYDPRLEASWRRAAAQGLREIEKRLGIKELIEQAEAWEKEAGQIG